MTTKTVYQFDLSGILVGETIADESPLEPGVWLMPARTTEAEPPAYDADQVPQWNGVAWHIVARPPAPSAVELALEKLKSFLAANPEVAAYFNQGGV